MSTSGKVMGKSMVACFIISGVIPGECWCGEFFPWTYSPWTFPLVRGRKCPGEYVQGKMSYTPRFKCTLLSRLPIVITTNTSI